jgi:hypothetical protein
MIAKFIIVGDNSVNKGTRFLLKTAVEHSKIPFGLSLSKGERDFGMPTKWVGCVGAVHASTSSARTAPTHLNCGFRFMRVKITCMTLKRLAFHFMRNKALLLIILLIVSGSVLAEQGSPGDAGNTLI